MRDRTEEMILRASEFDNIAVSTYERRLRFLKRNPEVKITYPTESASGLWEVLLPDSGDSAETYETSAAMMDSLEKRFPESTVSRRDEQ